MTKKLFLIPLYPFFIGIYPVLALLSSNMGQVRYSAGIRPFVLSILFTLSLFFLLRLVYRDLHKAAFATASLVILLFTYGQVYDLILSKWEIANFASWMLTLYLLFVILIFLVAAMHKVKFKAVAFTFNVISLGLLIYPTVQIVQASLKKFPTATKPPLISTQELHVPQGQVRPDIYYIMPEDYGRADLLQSKFQIDVSQFIQDLKNMGFYVAECSQSNYATSELSLGSALNMEYLQNLDNSFKPDTTNQRPIWDAIRYSAVVSDLKKFGYKTVAFATGYAWSELDNADVYISPPPLTSGITNFESLLLRTTPLRHLQELELFNLDEIDGEQYRERTMLEFNSMDELARMTGPKFVFVHIINPHEPFVFGPDGSPIDPAPFMNAKHLYTFDSYTSGYQNQIPFLNTMLEKSIQTLISKSATPPVILLQTDTAPLFMSGSDQFKILNAYYMPGHTDQLYQTISPVNTFRVLFNTYFDANFPLLNDVSYKSPIPYIYNFTKIPNAPCIGN